MYIPYKLIFLPYITASSSSSNNNNNNNNSAMAKFTTNTHLAYFNL